MLPASMVILPPGGCTARLPRKGTAVSVTLGQECWSCRVSFARQFRQPNSGGLGSCGEGSDGFEEVAEVGHVGFDGGDLGGVG